MKIEFTTEDISYIGFFVAIICGIFILKGCYGERVRLEQELWKATNSPAAAQHATYWTVMSNHVMETTNYLR